MDKVIYMRDLDGTGSMHPCLKGDPGAVAYEPVNANVRLAAKVLMSCWHREETYFIRLTPEKLRDVKWAFSVLEVL
jgi:hypothetical protein